MVQNALLEIITVADDSYKNAKTNITTKKKNIFLAGKSQKPE